MVVVGTGATSRGACQRAAGSRLSPSLATATAVSALRAQRRLSGGCALRAPVRAAGHDGGGDRGGAGRGGGGA